MRRRLTSNWESLTPGFGTTRATGPSPGGSAGGGHGGFRFPEELTMAESTLRISRIWSGLGIGLQGEAWTIVLDGTVVGRIANQETVEVALHPGRHRLRLGDGRHLSPERSFDVGEDEMVNFHCHGPRFWPQLVAAAVMPKLWITLRRS